MLRLTSRPFSIVQHLWVRRCIPEPCVAGGRAARVAVPALISHESDRCNALRDRSPVYVNCRVEVLAIVEDVAVCCAGRVGGALPLADAWIGAITYGEEVDGACVRVEDRIEEAEGFGRVTNACGVIKAGRAAQRSRIA